MHFLSYKIKWTYTKHHGRPRGPLSSGRGTEVWSKPALSWDCFFGENLLSEWIISIAWIAVLIFQASTLIVCLHNRYYPPILSGRSHKDPPTLLLIPQTLFYPVPGGTSTAGNKRGSGASSPQANTQSNTQGLLRRKPYSQMFTRIKKWLFYVLVLLGKPSKTFLLGFWDSYFQSQIRQSLEHTYKEIHISQKRVHCREKVGGFQTLKTSVVQMPKCHSDYSGHSRLTASAV